MENNNNNSSISSSSKQILRRNLAFYHKDIGHVWTGKEIYKIMKEVGTVDNRSEERIIESVGTTRYTGYIFDDQYGPKFFMYPWSEQEKHKNFHNCRKIEYTSYFN